MVLKSDSGLIFGMKVFYSEYKLSILFSHCESEHLKLADLNPLLRNPGLPPIFGTIQPELQGARLILTKAHMQQLYSVYN